MKAPRRRQVSVAIGTHLCSSKQSPPPNYSKETREIVVGSTLKLQIRSASPSAGFRLCGRTPRKLFLLFFSFHFQQQWRSGGWRRWTPMDRTAVPHLKTTFISLRQSRTAAGLWTHRATPRRFTTTRPWLTRGGRCPETTKRYCYCSF